MYCWKCGAKNDDSANYCNSCGSELNNPAGAGGNAGANQSAKTRPLASVIVPVVVLAIGVAIGAYMFGPGRSESVSSAGTITQNVASEVSSNAASNVSSDTASEDVGGDANSATTETSADGPTESAQEQEEQQVIPDYRIVTDDFEFDIPEYWRGKVDYYTTTNDEGMSCVVVYPITALTQDPGTASTYTLATINAVAPDSPTAMNAGDIISHIAGKAEGSGKTVVVHSTNWPAERATFMYNNPNYGGSSQEHEMFDALVDLVTGGAVTMGDVRDAAQNAANAGEASGSFPAADVNYLQQSLIPTIVVH